MSQVSRQKTNRPTNQAQLYFILYDNDIAHSYSISRGTETKVSSRIYSTGQGPEKVKSHAEFVHRFIHALILIY